MVSCNHDTDREQASICGAEVARQSERNLLVRQTHPRLLNVIHDAVIVWDLFSDVIRYWNAGAEALYGWTAHEAIGQPITSLLRTTTSIVPADLISADIEAASWEGELQQTARNGHVLIVESRWTVRNDDRGLVVIQADADITGLKELEESTAALIAAQRAEVGRLQQLALLKADFTRMVAHELQGPLSAFSLRLDMLATGELDPVSQAQALAEMRAELSLLNVLVHDVAAASMSERADFAICPRPVPLSSILNDAAAFFTSLPGQHPLMMENMLSEELEECDVLVLADCARIGQVLRNLLDNAARYSAAGTPIVLRAAALRPSGMVRISVIDRGQGIHPDDLPRIFEKFGRGRDLNGRHVSGVGLGLYLSRRIVQLHGGDLTVTSALGAGSTFAFTVRRIQA